MSDRDTAPDPIDQAYDQAEALLSDAAARDARRTRVLAAVAREPLEPSAARGPSIRRSPWRRGGWLAAASVAGLGLFVSVHLYQPALRSPPTSPAAPAATAPEASPAGARDVVASPTQSAERSSRTPKPAPRSFTAAPQVGVRPETGVQADAPPTLLAPLAEKAFPAAATASARRDAPVDLPPPPRLELAPAPRAPAPPTDQSEGAFKASPNIAAPSRFGSTVRPQPDPAARLRAAATDGRTEALETLLAQGVAIDAPDADGNTALIDAVRSGHPAAAALLHRHGASLDRRNHGGESARDLAAAKGDAELNQALGLDP